MRWQGRAQVQSAFRVVHRQPTTTGGYFNYIRRPHWLHTNVANAGHKWHIFPRLYQTADTPHITVLLLCNYVLRNDIALEATQNDPVVLSSFFRKATDTAPNIQLPSTRRTVTKNLNRGLFGAKDSSGYLVLWPPKSPQRQTAWMVQSLSGTKITCELWETRLSTDCQTDQFV